MSVSAQKLATWTIGVSLVVLGLKWLAFVVTGSVALYSDALESVVNVVAALLALVAIHVSAIPPDTNHHYGHSKAEYLSAVIEGAMIVLAAVLIMNEAYHAFLSPRLIEAPATGLVLNGVATGLNALWAMVLIRAGRQTRSPALAADGRHLMTDVVTSVGVVLGLVLAQITGWPWLDPAIAILVALHVLWAGWVLIRTSVDGLMDAAPDLHVRRRIETLIAENGDGGLQAHDLRMRQTGRATYVEFHLIVPGDMSVSASHAICDRIEQAIRSEFNDTAISIHVEPDHKKKSGEGVELGTG